MRLICTLLAFCFVTASAHGAEHPPGTVTDGGAKVPLGKFFLVRHGDEHAAVMLTAAITNGDGGVAYVWSAQSDGSGSFTNATAKHGRGEAFEKYRRVHRDDGDDGYDVENDGGVLHIRCGILRAEWSLSNWVYFDSPAGPLEIAFTEETSIETINYLDPELTWHTGKKQKISQPSSGGDSVKAADGLH